MCQWHALSRRRLLQGTGLTSLLLTIGCGQLPLAGPSARSHAAPDRVPQVGYLALRAMTEPLQRQRIEALLAARADGDHRALRGHRQRSRLADPRRAAGDQNLASVERVGAVVALLKREVKQRP